MESSETIITTKGSNAFKKQAFKDQITGLLFTLPAFLIIFIFGIFPIGYSVYMSLFNWQVTKGAFIGDKNYLLIFGSWTNLLVLLAG